MLNTINQICQVFRGGILNSLTFKFSPASSIADVKC